MNDAKESIGVDYMSALPLYRERVLARFGDGFPEAVIELVEACFLRVDKEH